MINSREKKILVTGSTGFIGEYLITQLKASGKKVIAISRSRHKNSQAAVDITGETNWSELLKGVDTVVHCAAAVHEMAPSEVTLENYQRVNIEGTLNLAEQAKKSVRRFIFLSTIKVNGEETLTQKFLADEPPNPKNPYALSKAKAEEGLRNIARNSNMDFVIIRPPLVYGPKAKGNLAILSKLVESRLPLPLGSVRFNSRSLVYVGNLVNFISLCISHDAAKNQTFLISDGEDLSTREIISHVARAIGKKPLLVPFPVAGLKLLFRAIGKPDYETKLLNSLCVDVTKNRLLLGWEAKYSVDHGFQRSFGN